MLKDMEFVQTLWKYSPLLLFGSRAAAVLLFTTVVQVPNLSVTTTIQIIETIYAFVVVIPEWSAIR